MTRAYGLRRRVLRRKRLEFVLTWAYRSLAAAGVLFIVAMVIGAIG